MSRKNGCIPGNLVPNLMTITELEAQKDKTQPLPYRSSLSSQRGRLLKKKKAILLSVELYGTHEEG